MTYTKKGRIYLLFAALSAFFSYLIIILNNFPYFGISVALITFTVIAYTLKSNKTGFTKNLLIFTLIFAAFISVRSEGLITFFNFTAALFFGSLMMLSSKKQKPLNAVRAAISPFYLILRSIFTKSEYYLEKQEQKLVKRKVKQVEFIGGILISILLLAIILPLLASANPYFEKLLNDIGKLLQFENLNYETTFLWSLRLVFFLLFLFIIPKLITLSNKVAAILPDIPFVDTFLPLLIPKIVVSTVLLIFFITQLELYFSSPDTLAKLGLSYSQYTREVFGQLSVVAAIVLGLLYNDKQKEKFHKILTYILAIQVLFLTLMAFKSVYEYSNTWGFTYKRLYGFIAVFWLIGVLTTYLETYIKSLSDSTFIKRIIYFTGITLIIVNLANFDYLIYNYRKSTTGQGVDYRYLSGLSSDSLSLDEQYKELIQRIKANPQDIDRQNTYVARRLMPKIEYIRKRYNNLDLRTFNLLDYIQYKQLRPIDTQEYYELTKSSALPYYPPQQNNRL